jgi:hypothetical protein
MNRYLADVPPQETVATFLAGQLPVSAFCFRLQASSVWRFPFLAFWSLWKPENLESPVKAGLSGQ